MPRTSRKAFKILNETGMINESLTKSLMNMAGFRNIAVHDDQRINLDILQAIIENYLQDFTEFAKQVLTP